MQETAEENVEFIEIFKYSEVEDPIKYFEFDDETGHLFIATEFKSSILVFERIGEPLIFKKAHILEFHKSEISGLTLSRKQKILFSSSIDGQVIQLNYG